MTIYYLSGPMRGKPNHNRELFREVEGALRSFLGTDRHDVINPSKNFDGEQTREPSLYMALDLRQVIEADAIVQLPGWQSSEGARREAELAVWVGKEFIKATWVESSYDGEEHRGGWQFTAIDGPEFSDSIRAQACDEGKQLITGDRNNAYGPPWQDFQRSSDAMTAYGYRHTQLPASAPPCPACGARPLASHDTAIVVDCIKTSRIMWSPTKRDHWVDKIGYAGCGFECALHDAEREKGREK